MSAPPWRFVSERKNSATPVSPRQCFSSILGKFTLHKGTLYSPWTGGWLDLDSGLTCCEGLLSHTEIDPRSSSGLIIDTGIQELHCLRFTVSLNTKKLSECSTCPKNVHVTWCPVSASDKAGDTLSSRHMSSCDVTRAVGMWEGI